MKHFNIMIGFLAGIATLTLLPSNLIILLLIMFLFYFFH